MAEEQHHNKKHKRSVEDFAEDDIIEPEKKVLSKRVRMINSSEFKRQVFYALENMKQGKLITKIVGVFLFLLIVANAVLVFLSAQPDLDPIATASLKVFFVFSTVCFFIEYVCRVWIADLAFGNCTRGRARVKYIFSALGIIDFLSFAPSMIAWFLPASTTLIHVVNMLRLIRLVKVTRYMRGFRTMGRVMRKHYHEIVASFLVILLVIIVTSVVMYEAEHAAQPEKFNSLFQGVWFAVQTVTTTGYGDIVPITTVGKICGMVIMMLSLGLVAIPGGIFSAGFVAEFQHANLRKIERDVEHNKGKNDSESNSASTGGVDVGPKQVDDKSEDED